MDTYKEGLKTSAVTIIGNVLLAIIKIFAGIGRWISHIIRCINHRGSRDGLKNIHEKSR